MFHVAVLRTNKKKIARYIFRVTHKAPTKKHSADVHIREGGDNQENLSYYPQQVKPAI